MPAVRLLPRQLAACAFAWLLFAVSAPAAEFPIVPGQGGASILRPAVSLAGDDAGRFVVVYAAAGGASGREIRAQRFRADGSLLGAEIAVNTYTTGNQSRAAVAAAAGGGFVVVWESPGQDGSEFGIFGRLFDASGAPVGGEFQVNAHTTGDQIQPDVGMDDTGNFTVVWADWAATPLSILGRQYDAAGTPIGGEFVVHDTIALAPPSMAMRDNGEFMVVWTGGAGYTFGRGFAASGVPLAGRFTIGGLGYSMDQSSAVDVAGTAGFAVVWAEYAGYLAIRTRRFDPTGAPLGPTEEVSSSYGGPPLPGVALGGDGESLATHTVDWSQPSRHVRAHRSSPSFPPQASFRVWAATTANPSPASASVARDPAGGFVVTWESQYGIFGRRVLPCTNALPIPVDDQDTVPHDRPLILDLLANDSDPNGEPLTVAAVTQPPGRGTVVINADGTVTLTPAPGFLGPVTFTYAVENARPCRAFATATVDVTNAAPTPAADTATTPVNVQADIDVLANDSDPDGDSLTLIGTVWASTHGGLVFVDNKGTQDPSDDTIRYSPPITFVGVDLFSYEVRDDLGAAAWATVSVTMPVPLGLAASELLVDEVAGPASDGNGVLEPGETATVGPRWRNTTNGFFPFSGSATAFTGPSGLDYEVLDDRASYAAIWPDTIGDCGSDCYGVRVGSLPVVSNRTAVHRDAAFSESLSNGDTFTWAVHLGESFFDVPRASAFYRHAETLLHTGVSTGCAQGRFCPLASVARAEMATFVLKAKEGAGFAPPPCSIPVFRDVRASDPHCPFVEEIARRGVDSGCGGGFFCPYAPLPREQAAVFLLATREAAGYLPPPCGTPMFADVPASSPYCRWIEELVRRGFATGCAAGKFCPQAAITREQAAALLTLTFGLKLYGP